MQRALARLRQPARELAACRCALGAAAGAPRSFAGGAGLCKAEEPSSKRDYPAQARVAVGVVIVRPSAASGLEVLLARRAKVLTFN